jgi:SAM-dependent methyltransferase
MHADFYDRAYFDGAGKSNYCRYTIDSSPFAAHANTIVAVLSEFSLRGPVLDVGCAKGYLVSVLRQRGVDAFGVDWSPYALASAPPQARPFLSRASAHELPFPDKHFALVVTFDVLEHMDVSYARTALVETARVSQHQLHQANTGRLDEWHFDGDDSHCTKLPLASWRGMAADLGLDRTIICEPDSHAGS